MHVEKMLNAFKVKDLKKSFFTLGYIKPLLNLLARFCTGDIKNFEKGKKHQWKEDH